MMKTICYLSGGYPTMDKSMEMAQLYLEGGCDAIEWSLPPNNPYMEPDYIAAKMKVARDGCSDYQVYLEQVSAFKKKNPRAAVYLLLYQETVLEIGCQALVKYLKENNIDTIITADIADPEILRIFQENNIHIAPFVSFEMKEKELQAAMGSSGFIYMQAMPFAHQRTPDFDPATLGNCIARLREMGIDRPIYCGGGIRTPQDVAMIRRNGGNGYFIGSGVMQHYDNPAMLLKTLLDYKKAAEDSY